MHSLHSRSVEEYAKKLESPSSEVRLKAIETLEYVPLKI